jgi:hypothetical protein
LRGTIQAKPVQTKRARIANLARVGGYLGQYGLVACKNRLGPRMGNKAQPDCWGYDSRPVAASRAPYGTPPKIDQSYVRIVFNL